MELQRKPIAIGKSASEKTYWIFYKISIWSKKLRKNRTQYLKNQFNVGIIWKLLIKLKKYSESWVGPNMSFFFGISQKNLNKIIRENLDSPKGCLTFLECIIVENFRLQCGTMPVAACVPRWQSDEIYYYYFFTIFLLKKQKKLIYIIML